MSSSQNNRNNAPQPSSSGWLGLGVLAAAAIGGFAGYVIGSSSEENQRHQEARQQYRGRTNRVPIAPPTECAICREDMSPPMEQLPCNHLYHQKCILQWLQTGTECPQCRYKLSREQIDKYLARG